MASCMAILKKPHPGLIRTERLILRPVGEQDIRRIAELAGDWDVARMTGRVPYPYSEALAREWITGLQEGEFVRGIEFEGKLIGVCGYTPGKRRTAEIGYWIGKPYWGHGFATEAAQAIVDYCFRTAGLTRLTCCHFVENEASARVIEKLRFRRTGSARGWCEARRIEVDTVQYEKRRPLVAILRQLTP
jgi:RimJ/RimL family protein N-acetyltransferase